MYLNCLAPRGCVFDLGTEGESRNMGSMVVGKNIFGLEGTEYAGSPLGYSGNRGLREGREVEKRILDLHHTVLHILLH